MDGFLRTFSTADIRDLWRQDLLFAIIVNRWQQKPSVQCVEKKGQLRSITFRISENVPFEHDGQKEGSTFKDGKERKYVQCML